MDKGKFDKAIDGFKKAWEHAQQAIKAAKPKGKGKYTRNTNKNPSAD